jgi:hypothetical protein
MIFIKFYFLVEFWCSRQKSKRILTPPGALHRLPTDYPGLLKISRLE